MAAIRRLEFKKKFRSWYIDWRWFLTVLLCTKFYQNLI